MSAALVLGLSSVLLAGCGSSSADSGVSVEDLKVGYASDIDSADVAALMGIDDLGGPDPISASEDSAIIAGLLSEEFHIGNADLLSAILAKGNGADVTVIYPELMTYQYVMIAQPEIQSLDDLAGKTVAFHSPGSEDEILCRALVRQHDPELEDKINWKVLPESPNRASAFVGGEIDATALEFGDTLTVAEQTEFTTLGGWTDVEGASSAAIANSWVVSNKFLEENRDVVVEFVQALQKGYDEFYADKDAWMAKADEVLPDDVSTDFLAQIYDFYAEVKLYPNGEDQTLSEDRWGELNQFFMDIGQIEEPAPDDMVDFDLMSDVN